MLSPEPQTSSGKLTFQRNFSLVVGDSRQEVSASQGKEVGALQGEDPTCHMTSLVSESSLALGLHFEDEETGSPRDAISS